MYWIYDFPNWQLCLLTITAFVVVSVAGFYITRPLVGWLVKRSGKHNDIASYYFAGVVVLYGLTLGLIGVGTWQNFSDADTKASKEASSIGALYRDLDGYPTALRSAAEDKLREYVRAVIDKEWPAHRKGQTLDEGDLILDDLENMVMVFEPTSEPAKIAHMEVIMRLNAVEQNRGLRVQSVNTALPAVLWVIVLLGAWLNIAMTYLFWVENTALQAVLVAAFAVLLGMLIFLPAAMDNPFRGEFSVSPDAYQYVLDHTMTTTGK